MESWQVGTWHGVDELMTIKEVDSEEAKINAYYSNLE